MVNAIARDLVKSYSRIFAKGVAVVSNEPVEVLGEALIIRTAVALQSTESEVPSALEELAKVVLDHEFKRLFVRLAKDLREENSPYAMIDSFANHFRITAWSELAVALETLGRSIVAV